MCGWLFSMSFILSTLVCLFSIGGNGLQLKEVGGFLPRFFCGGEFLFYHYFFCGAQCRQFLLGAVMGWLSLLKHYFSDVNDVPLWVNNLNEIQSIATPSCQV